MELGKQIKKWGKSKRNGSALALSMFVILLLFVVGIGVLSLGMHRRLQEVRACSEISARSAADSGLTHALYSMNQMLEAKTWSEGSLPSATDAPLPNTDATFSYNVDTVKVDGNDVYVIESIGKYGLAQRTVRSTLELKSLFEYAIFVAEEITLKMGTTITAYNVDAGDKPLQIGTNSTTTGAITAKVGVIIDGDVVVGSDGDPETVINNQNESVITGQTNPQLKNEKFRQIKVPQYLKDMVSSGVLTSSITLNGPAKYDSVNLTGSVGADTVTIDGVVELYIVGDLRIGNSDQIVIVDANTNPNASLVIYLGGNLIIDNSGAINNLTKDASKLKVFGLNTCSYIDFKNSGNFFGAIYAPNADVRLHNSVQMYGAVTCRSFVQDVNANFYYDMNLREAAPNEIGAHLEIKYWSED
jgi:hypothetical protein